MFSVDPLWDKNSMTIKVLGSSSSSRIIGNRTRLECDCHSSSKGNSSSNNVKTDQFGRIRML